MVANLFSGSSSSGRLKLCATRRIGRLFLISKPFRRILFKRFAAGSYGESDQGATCSCLFLAPGGRNLLGSSPHLFEDFQQPARPALDDAGVDGTPLLLEPSSG